MGSPSCGQAFHPVQEEGGPGGHLPWSQTQLPNPAHQPQATHVLVKHCMENQVQAPKLAPSSKNDVPQIHEMSPPKIY